MSTLDNKDIRDALGQAWRDSNPGSYDAQEQGGFIVQHDDGSLTVERWPRGQQDQITVPDHTGGKYQEATIVATFHTHPNTGPDYQQEPSVTDIRAVSADPVLRHAAYEGEYVISQETVYLIRTDGTVTTVGNTVDLL